MKCDELQERWFEAYPVEGDQIIPTKVYGKKDADDAIAKLKRENENLKDAFGGTTIAYKQVCDEYEQCDKWLRATKRALWLARGYIMTLLNRDFQRLAYQCNNDDYKRNLLRRRNRYYELSEKCLKKAKEYK